MGERRAWEDEYTLLCERCGYVIEGLPRDGACPECGKPIAESLPERRAGTPWQRHPGMTNLIGTWIESLFHPLRTLDKLSEVPRRDRWLRRWTTLAAAVLLALGWWQFGAMSIVRERPLTALVFVAFVLVCAIPVWILLSGLTHIEAWGLSVIARSRGFRVPKTARRATTAHGCVGWLLAGVMLVVITLGLDLLYVQFAKPYIPYDPSEPMMDQFAAAFEGGPPRWLVFLNYASRGVSIIVGFLFFETFAWLGLRRLKYANRVRPADAVTPPDA